MVDKRVCNWTEVKPGEVFVVHKQTKRWSDLTYQRDGVPLTIERGYVATYPHKQQILIHPSSPAFKRHYDQTIATIKQEVEIVDPENFGNEEKINMMPQGKINGTTGCDPEIFAVRGKTGRLIPAWKYLPTQKEAQVSNKGAYARSAWAYRDGFAAEYYTQPAGCHAYLVDYIREGLQRVLIAAQKFDDTARLTIKNTYTISTLTMNAAKDEDVALGCMPSMNAYKDDPLLPTDGKKFKLRFAGGHVHLGIGALGADRAIRTVKGCDLIAGVTSVALFASLDTPVRRRFYGRAGEFRLPRHGLEYRVLSNAWLMAPAVTHLVLNLVRIGAKVGANDYTKYFDLPEEKVREIINFCDVDSARKWCDSHLDVLNNLLTLDGAYSSKTALRKITQGGVEELYKDVDNISEHWMLNTTKWIAHSEGTNCQWSKMCNSVK